MPVTIKEIAILKKDVPCVIIEDSKFTYGHTEFPASDETVAGQAVTGASAGTAGRVRLTFSGSGIDAGNNTAHGHMGPEPLPIMVWGVGGTTEANGRFLWERVTDNSIDLIGTTFTNAYTSGGRMAYYKDNRATGTGTDPVTGLSSRYLMGNTPRMRRWVNKFPAATDFLQAGWEVAGNWGTIGARTVTKVSRKKVALQDAWFYYSTANIFVRQVRFRHYIYLTLSGDLAQGAYTVTPPVATGLAAYSWTFDDKVTRFIALTPSAVYGSSDEDKQATMGHWAPGVGTEHGAISYSALTGTSFEIINELGLSEYTGTIAARLSPTASDPHQPSIYMQWAHENWMPSSTDPINTITGIATGAATVVTYNNGPGTIADGTRVFVDNIFNDPVIVPGNYSVPLSQSHGWAEATTATTFKLRRRVNLTTISTVSGTNAVTVNVDVDHRMSTGAQVVFPSTVVVNGTTITAGTFTITNSPGAGSTSFTINGTGNASSTGTVTPTTQVLSCDISTTGTYVSGGKVYRSIVINPSGTYTYNLDFGAYPAAVSGRKRIRVPGYGVSLYFRCDQAGWFEITKKVLGSLYNQRIGQPKSGFGYDTALSDQTMPVVKSLLPGIWHAENSGIINHAHGAAGPWRTSTTVAATEVTGMHWDAGDHDGSFPGHFKLIWQLLDIYLLLPSAVRNTKWGLPSISSRQGAGFAALDGLGDLVNEAVNFCNAWKRLQNVDGSFPGNIQFTHEDTKQASWQNAQPFYLSAPDFTTFFQAGIIAKLAHVLKTIGTETSNAAITAIGNDFLASAESAWTWVNNIYTNDAARLAYYEPARAIAEAQYGAGSWTGATYTAFDTSLKGTTSARGRGNSGRLAAAGALYLATGSATYKDAFTETLTGSTSGTTPVSCFGDYVPYEACAIGLVDYARKATVGDTLRTNIINSYTGTINLSVANSNPAQASTTAYRMLKVTGQWGFGLNGANVDAYGFVVYVAHSFSANSTTRANAMKSLQAQAAYLLGSNQIGRSWYTGIGTDPMLGHLHNDQQGAGQDFWPGQGAYGPRPSVGAIRFGNHIGKAYTSTIMENADTSSADHIGTNRQFHSLEPNRLAFPINEQWINVHNEIEMSEFTIAQQNPLGAHMLYVAYHDGTLTETKINGGRARVVARCAA